MYASAFVLGFHGCDQSVGEKVLSGGQHLKHSSNDYDWLGHGAYFWENSPQRARQWAEFVRDHPRYFKTKITAPFVVGAIINLGLCLDLTEAASLDEIKKGHEIFVFSQELSNAPLPQNEQGAPGDADRIKRKLDCAVINYVDVLRDLEKRPPFDTVRGAFHEGGPLYAGAQIMAKTHIQISVRQPKKSVLGYFRPAADAFSE